MNVFWAVLATVGFLYVAVLVGGGFVLYWGMRSQEHAAKIERMRQEPFSAPFSGRQVGGRGE